MTSSSLQYLSFDFSAADDGSGTFDALASVPPRALVGLQAEVCRVLGWAQAQFPGERGPLEDGNSWDVELRGSVERSTAQRLDYDEATGRLQVQDEGAETLRHTVSLSIAGSEAFCEAFRTAFGLDSEED